MQCARKYIQRNTGADVDGFPYFFLPSSPPPPSPLHTHTPPMTLKVLQFMDVGMKVEVFYII